MKKDNLPHAKDSWLFQQKPMKKILDDKPFSVDDIFDKTFKEGKKVKYAPKEKPKVKETLATSFFKKSEKANSKTYNYQRF